MNVLVVPHPLYNNSIPVSSSTSYDSPSKSSFKAGRFFGKAARKVKKLFSSKKSKVTILGSYWVIESVVFFSLLALKPSLFIVFLSTFMHIYATYAIYTAINILIK
jgi:hypothetical protein